VPGRIVETDEKVTFIAGQVVDTPEGFRFIAPDLKNEGDDFEFNLQGFQVAPEELALINPKNTYSTSFINHSEFAIDSAMMKQLAEAGMSIGRQVEPSDVGLVLQSTINREIVEQFSKANAIDYDVASSIFKMIKTLTDEHKGKINPENLTAKILELCLPTTSSIIQQQQQQQGESQTGHQSTDETNAATGNKKPKRKTGVAFSLNVADATQAQALETNQIVNILTKVMMEILKSDELMGVDEGGNGTALFGAATAANGHHANGGGGNAQHHKNKVESVYEIIANVLNASVESLNIEQLQNSFSSPNMTELVLEKLNNTISKVETMCKIEEMKQNLLNSAFGVAKKGSARAQANGGKVSVTPQIMVNDNDFVIEQFCDIVDDFDVASAFSAMTKDNPQLLLNVLNAIQNANDVANPSVSMKETIQKAIVAAVNAENNNKIDELLATDDVHHVESVLNEALLLAKVLGLNAEAMTLLSALDSATKSGDVGKVVLDEAAKAIIRRVCVMKQLAAVDPDYREALELLQQSPHRAVKDEIVRELVRKSGLISIELKHDSPKIESSNDIPASLLAADNVLAMEDFMLRSGSGNRAFLIIKDGIQCVVPREKSHDVLTGKCAYSVLDENGIRHFEPLHVIDALKLNTATQHHRFSIYANDKAIEELAKLRKSSCSPTYDTQARDFQFSACDFADNLDNNSSDMGDASENGDFGEFFVPNVNYDVDTDTGYRRPRRRRVNDKDDPTSNLDFQTTQMLRKRRGARPDRKSKSPLTTQVYRQYTQVNDNIYMMHAYVFHEKDKSRKNTR